MGDLALDTALWGGNGRYTARLSQEWEIWGPMGGYVATVALRAAGAASSLPRPASFTCQFLNTAKFDVVDLEVTTLRASKRTEALRVSMTQEAKPILEALVWVVAADGDGLEHDAVRMPDVPGPEKLKSFDELSGTKSWYPYWTNVEARPTQWVPWEEWEPGAPEWKVWMQLKAAPTFDDPFLNAARSVVFLDTGTWPAASSAHVPPHPHIAPNLDLSVRFHRAVPEAEWLLVDGFSPIATEGLIGCTGRTWTPDGRLVASAASQLICRPNPFYEQHKQEIEARSTKTA